MRAFFAGCLLGSAAMLAHSSALAAGWTYRIVASSASGNRQNIARFDTALDMPAINDAGEIVFPAWNLTGESGTAAVWISRHGIPARQVASVAAGDFTAYASINAAGVISFTDSGAAAQVLHGIPSDLHRLPPATDTNAPASVVTGKGSVIVGTGDGLVLFAGGRGMVANPGYCTTSAPLASNEAGEVAYTDCDFESPTIYVTDTSSATTGLLAASGTDGMGTVGFPVIDGSGLVAFSGTALAGQTGNVSAVYTASLSTAPAVLIYANNGACSLASGPPAGTQSCTVTSYYPAAINAAGVVGYQVDTLVSGTAPHLSYATTSALRWLARPMAAPILATGDKIGDCAMSGIGVGPQGLNASGQVAAIVSCADMTSRIVLATPRP